MNDLDRLEPENLNLIYKEIAELFGLEIAQKFFAHFKGLQINYPVRFLSKKYVQKVLNEEYDGTNLKSLSKKYGYSERWLRIIIKNSECSGGSINE